MFRNPRENAIRNTTDQVLPSTGRPPSPTNGLFSGPGTDATKSPFFTPNKDPKATWNPLTRMPVLGTIPQAKISSAKRNVVKQNKSITSFFTKAEKKEAEPVAEGADLFFASQETTTTPQKPATNVDSQSTEYSSRWNGWSQDDTRFNEIETPLKKRRLEREGSPSSLFSSPVSTSITKQKPTDMQVEDQPPKAVKRRGGFVDDSEDEEDNEPVPDISEEDVDKPQGREVQTEAEIKEEQDVTPPIQDKEIDYVEVTQESKVPLRPADEGGKNIDLPRLQRRGTTASQLDDDGIDRPQLQRHGTSGFQVDEFGPEDFEDEFFPEGEEFMERRYMEEQMEMERAFDDDSKSESGTEGPSTPNGASTPRLQAETTETEDSEEAVAACPICNGLMKGMTEAEASTHVNACLDGTAKPLPQPEVKTKQEPDRSRSTTPQPGPVLGSGRPRFKRAAIARPAQANPFEKASKAEGKSAFSQLMSGHAEDRAWAEAAANEMQARGKPAYQRTCPFYKIMPGLFICVDAFRYGKVEGQNAYFLSHFHSDHYIGLTSQWSHGPIYASKVTCNLMVQQLRVDKKWVVPLEFEKKVEVPNTNGVFVTMIPANHCPGSSLYLFEKVVGKNKDGSPKLNRILHCGDFRACPAHIHHPQLRPETVDAVSGQTKEQKIDTCYLDTTYLTPKYAFPSQFDVIDACAQMCVSLSSEIVDNKDAWEQAKLERQGSTMSKFLEKGAEQSPVKKEEEEEDVKPKTRGRLLVVVGTYSIGKERICLGIARALKSKIWAPPPKMRICKALEDDELNSLLTSNPLEAQVHMQMLMEIRAETLLDYMLSFGKGKFSRVVGFRPTGWSYRPPGSRMLDNPGVPTVLYSENWKSRFTMRDLVPQRGSTRESNCFGVPYSEHSSFRELTMFCCALNIRRIIPTVNVGSAKSRQKMQGWIAKWDADKQKNGLFKVDNIQEGWGSGDGQLRYGV